MRKMRLKEKGVFLPFLQAVNVATEHNRGVSTLGAQTQQNKTAGVFFSCLSFHSFYVCPIPSLSY
jgi:hypothetical protein